MCIQKLAVVLGLLLPVFGTHQSDAADSDQAVAVEPDRTSTLVGRVLYDGEPPEPRLLQIPVRLRVRHEGLEFDSEELPDRRRIQARGVPDESLIVGEERGIANVIVWVRSKNVPIPPRRGPFPPVIVQAEKMRFKPRVLPFWNAVPLVWINESGAGVNFNLSSGIQQNRLLNDGQRVEIDVKKALAVPSPLTSNIQPWFQSHVLPLPHPYFAVTGGDGRFEIKNLPDGDWEFALWHERSGWLATDKFPRGRFKFTVNPGKNDLGDLSVDPETVAKRVIHVPVAGGPPANPKTVGNALSELHHAAMEGHSQRVRDLVAGGANLNEREPRFNGTPLHYAARHGHAEVVQALIESWARVGARDTKGCTPLVWAVKGGHHDVICRLLDADADVNVRDVRGWTPLHYAVDRGHTQAAQLLLDRGGDPLVKNEDGKTALDLKPDIELKLHARQ